jgi:chromosome segregation ATPase
MAVITKEAVFEAANSLLEKNEKPTLSNVRKELGGGSFTTISDFMREWKTEQELANQPQVLRMPDVVNDTISKAAALIWETARDAAQDELVGERKALADVKAEMELQSHEAAEMADQMDSEINGLKAEVSESIELAEKSTADLELKTTALNDTRELLARAETRIEDLTKEVEDSQSEARSALEAITLNKAELAANAFKINEQGQVVLDLQAKLSNASTEADTAKGQLLEVQKSKVEQVSVIDQLRDELATSNVSAKTAEALNEQLKSDKSDFKSELAELNKALQKALTDNAKLEAIIPTKGKDNEHSTD